VSTLKSSAENLTLNADGSGNDIIFQSNGSTVVTVVGEGNVGIGVTPESSSSSYKALRIGESGNISSHTGTAHTLISNNAYIDTSDNYKYTETDQACLYEQDNAGKHYFKTAVSGSADAAITWTTPLTIANTGDITVGTGDIVFTTAGKGICLGVTSNTDANTLDDYEEGTWTPSIGGNASYSAQSGWYTKVGRLISVQGYMTINVIGTGSTSVITGLPIAATQPQPPSVVFGKRTNLSTSVVDLCGVIPGSGGSQINITGQTAAADNNTEGIACMGNGTILFFSVHYLTA